MLERTEKHADIKTWRIWNPQIQKYENMCDKKSKKQENMYGNEEPSEHTNLELRNGNIGTRERGTRSWRAEQGAGRHQTKIENEISSTTISLGK